MHRFRSILLSVVLCLLFISSPLYSSPFYAQVTDPLPLNNTFVASNLAVSIAYPTGWHVHPNEAALLAIQLSNSTRPAADPLPADQTVLNIFNDPLSTNVTVETVPFAPTVTAHIQNEVLQRQVMPQTLAVSGIEMLIFDFGEAPGGYGSILAMPFNEKRYIWAVALSGSEAQARADRDTVIAMMGSLRPATNAELAQNRPERSAGFDYQSGSNRVTSSSFRASLPEGFVEILESTGSIGRLLQDVAGGYFYSNPDTGLSFIISPAAAPGLSANLNVLNSLGGSLDVFAQGTSRQDITVDGRPMTEREGFIAVYAANSWRVATHTEDGAIFVIEGFRPAGGSISQADKGVLYGVAASIQATGGYPFVAQTYGETLVTTMPSEFQGARGGSIRYNQSVDNAVNALDYDYWIFEGDQGDVIAASVDAGTPSVSVGIFAYTGDQPPLITAPTSVTSSLNLNAPLATAQTPRSFADRGDAVTAVLELPSDGIYVIIVAGVIEWNEFPYTLTLLAGRDNASDITSWEDDLDVDYDTRPVVTDDSTGGGSFSIGETVSATIAGDRARGDRWELKAEPGASVDVIMMGGGPITLRMYADKMYTGVEFQNDDGYGSSISLVLPPDEDGVYMVDVDLDYQEGYAVSYRLTAQYAEVAYDEPDDALSDDSAFAHLPLITSSEEHDALLTESIINPDGTLSFRYPVGWIENNLPPVGKFAFLDSVANIEAIDQPGEISITGSFYLRTEDNLSRYSEVADLQITNALDAGGSYEELNFNGERGLIARSAVGDEAILSYMRETADGTILLMIVSLLEAERTTHEPLILSMFLTMGLE